ncbi:hypothetical protein [Nonomuraea insulae]|uniref:Haem-binding uptake Tiki superfamily ChaN domain-containing protein n=1 Tax=Nonomuraea insulae TaxID=1616787 RepID=A0ABW1CVB0_9ACTN
MTHHDRRRFIAVSAAGVTASLLGTPPAAATRGDLADVVHTAFRKHRLVAIGEVHGLQDHHDALRALLADPRLPSVVDDVVVEFGNARHQATMDRFIAGMPVENAELRKAWRDTTQSPLGTWDAPVYEQFFHTIRAINQTLPAAGRVRVLLGDPPIDWSAVTSREELTPFLVRRDSHAASVVEKEVIRKGRRALICYGTDHVLRTSAIVSAAEKLGAKTYVIAGLAPLAGDPGGLGKRLSRYERRSVIPASGTWLGRFDAGMVLPTPVKSPSGMSNKNCGVPLRSLIDAGLYLGEANELTMSRENPAIYLDDAYWEELRRRDTLYGGIVELDGLRKEQSVRFAPQELPASLRCE